MKLVDFLKDPEEAYSKNSARFVREGDFAGAARMAAYSIVLRDIKAKELGTLPADLKSFAMQSTPL